MKQRFRAMPGWVRNPLLGILFVTPFITLFYVLFEVLGVNVKEFVAYVWVAFVVLCLLSIIGLVVSKTFDLGT